MSIISKDSVIMRQAKNFRSLDIDAVLAKNIEKNHTQILSAQKNQLEFGFNSKGQKIKPKYAPDSKGNEVYAEEKFAMNQLAGFGTPDLNYSGDMQDNLEFEIDLSGDFFFFSPVPYFNDLEEKYQDAFGLSKKSIKKVSPPIQNDTLKEIHKLINK